MYFNLIRKRAENVYRSAIIELTATWYSTVIQYSRNFWRYIEPDETTGRSIVASTKAQPGGSVR